MSTTRDIGVTYRRFAPDEFPRLLPVYEALGDPPPVPENTVLYAAESHGEVVGHIAGQLVVCVSPLWVRRDFRGKGVAERLAREGYELLPAGMRKVFITRDRHVEMLAHRMGFIPKVGQLWMDVPAGNRYGLE